MFRWMVTFSPRHFTGCCNRPAFRDIFSADAEAYVEPHAEFVRSTLPQIDIWGILELTPQ